MEDRATRRKPSGAAGSAPLAAEIASPLAAAIASPSAAAPSSPDSETATPAGPYPGATQIIGQGPIGDPKNGLALNLTVGDTSTSAALTEVALRTYHASYSLPLPVPVTSVTLDLLGTGQPSSYGTWQVPIDSLKHGPIGDVDVGSFATSSLLAAKGAFDPSANGTSPRSGKRGFRIEVTGAQLPNADVLNVTVQVGRDPVWPNDQYKVIARVGGQQIEPTWQTTAPGMLIGQFDLAGPLRAQTVVVELSALPGADPLLGFAPVASYDMTVPRRGAAPGDILRRGRDATALRFTDSARHHSKRFHMEIELQLRGRCPGPVVPAPGQSHLRPGVRPVSGRHGDPDRAARAARAGPVPRASYGQGRVRHFAAHRRCRDACRPRRGGRYRRHGPWVIPSSRPNGDRLDHGVQRQPRPRPRE